MVGSDAGVFGALPGGVQVEVEQMSDDGLVRVTESIAQLRRHADALLARVAAEVDARSGSGFGNDGLAKKHHFHNPAEWWLRRSAFPEGMPQG